MRGIVFLALAGSVGCTAITHVDVTYMKCIVHGTRYVELFDGTRRDLEDCGWALDELDPTSKAVPKDGDLLLRATARDWTPTTQGELIYRRMPSDFLVVTRAEAS